MPQAITNLSVLSHLHVRAAGPPAATTPPLHLAIVSSRMVVPCFGLFRLCNLSGSVIVPDLLRFCASVPLHHYYELIDPAVRSILQFQLRRKRVQCYSFMTVADWEALRGSSAR